MDNFSNAKVYTTAANSSISSTLSANIKDKKSNGSNGDDYKPINYPSTTSSSSSAPAPSTKTSAIMAKHKITNNFKLPSFPVYVPSTTLASTLQHFQSTDPGSNNEASKNKDLLDSVSSTATTSISHLSSVSSSSPSSSGLNTNTLSLGRINPYLYQSESSLTNNSNVTMTTSITSSTCNTNNEKTASYTSPFLDQQSSYNNVFSSATLPKTSSSTHTDSYVSKLAHSVSGKNSEFSTSGHNKDTSSYSSYKYSTDYYSNITTTNNSSSNGTSTYTSSASDNIYRVQYSATNPFLDPLESSSSSSSTQDKEKEKDPLTSIFSKATATARGASSMVSEIARKFEKLDFEEDLK